MTTEGGGGLIRLVALLFLCGDRKRITDRLPVSASAKDSDWEFFHTENSHNRSSLPGGIDSASMTSRGRVISKTVPESNRRTLPVRSVRNIVPSPVKAMSHGISRRSINVSASMSVDGAVGRASQLGSASGVRCRYSSSGVGEDMGDSEVAVAVSVVVCVRDA